MANLELNRYQKTALATVAATLFLIFVGGLVRATGAGLGCPDWPKCFGLWIPPMDVSQLPAGFDESQFNVVKTWTEYINRLIGILVGFLITLTAIFSWKYRKSKPSITISSIAAFILVLFQGWLGGMVVRSALAGWLITLHLITAVIIVLLLFYATFKATHQLVPVTINSTQKTRILATLAVLLVILIIQTGMGTQVREMIDHVRGTYPDLARGNWLEETGVIYKIHRSFSWMVAIIGAIPIVLRKRWFPTPLMDKMVQALAALILVQIGLGVGMQFLNIPPTFQLLHLTFSVFMICLNYVMILFVQHAQPAAEGSNG